VRGLLNINPIERWSPLQAAQHPFITGRSYLGPFVPPISSAPIPLANAGTARVRVGKQRPRSNTLSSLSLQDVPPQIQRLAANRDKTTVVGPADRRDAIPEVDNLPPEGGNLPFETDATFSDSSSKQASASPMGKPAVDRMNAYVSNRRVSQPAVAARYGRQPYAGVPSSVPNAVWYGPEPFGMSPDPSKTARRRGSLRPEPEGVPTNTWSSPRRASVGTSRRSGLGGDSPEMDVVEEEKEERRDRD
jgi:hypothetical protein